MEPADLVTIRRLEHPDSAIRQVGFPLRHPYVELVWGSGVGPSVVHLLRQLPELWAGGDEVRMAACELAAGVGLPGQRKAFERTLKRVVDFDLGERLSRCEFAIYSQVRFLPRGILRDAPEWVVAAHERHVGALARQVEGAAGVGSDAVAAVRARLDQLQHLPRPASPTPPSLGR